MKRFKLRVFSHPDINQNWNEVIKLQRKYQNLEVFMERNHEYVDKLIEVLDEIGPNLKSVTLFRVQFSDPNDFIEIFKRTPQLKELDLDEVSFDIREDTKNLQCKVSLSALRKLKVKDCDWTVFDFVDSPYLNYLFLWQPKSNGHKLALFLNSLKKLSRLNCWYGTYQSVFDKPLVHQLKLNILGIYVREFESDSEVLRKNLCNFLESQSSSLEVLTLYDRPPTKAFEIALTKLSKLKTFRADKLPDDISSFQMLKPLTSLKSLYIASGFANSEIAKKLLGNCPNLVEFRSNHTNETFVKILPFVADFNPKLESITVSNAFSEMAKVKFGCLKNLSVEVCDRQEIVRSFIEFVKFNPSIKKVKNRQPLSLENLQFFVTEIMTQPNIKHLTISAYGKDLKAVFDTIKSNYKNLKTLTMEFSDFQSTLLITFPEDVKRWNPESVIIRSNNKVD